MDPAQFKARIEQIFKDLEAYTYYDLLNLRQDATVEEIRSAFHRMALSMHPDRHSRAADKELKRKLYLIYKRVAEGYRVLSNDESRREYHECLARGVRRLVKVERQRFKHAEDEIDNPQAKRFFKMAQEAERRGDTKNARINYKFVRDLIGDHPLILEKIAALDSE